MEEAETQMQHFISRRRFVATGAAAVAVSSLPRIAGAASYKHPLGVQLYMVSTELQADVPGTLKRLRGIGYTHVETFSLVGMTAPQFRKALDDADLKCHSCHLMFLGDDFGPLFAQANALGAKYAVSSILFPSNEQVPLTEMISKLSQLTLDDFKHMAAKANKIGEQAKTAGLQYCYHNHNFEFKDYGGTTGYDLLLKETDPELVKLELDCGWMTVGGQDPAAYFKKYPARYRLFHAKDFVALTPKSNSVDAKSRPAITEVGSGKVDWPSLVAAAKAAGVEYYYIDHDAPFVGKTALEAAKIDFDYLQPVLG
jgi:sugar phosphate isomerase/epimerase